jgi:hypothetical protein
MQMSSFAELCLPICAPCNDQNDLNGVAAWKRGTTAGALVRRYLENRGDAWDLVGELDSVLSNIKGTEHGQTFLDLATSLEESPASESMLTALASLADQEVEGGAALHEAIVLTLAIAIKRGASDVPDLAAMAVRELVVISSESGVPGEQCDMIIAAVHSLCGRRTPPTLRLVA